MIVVDANVVVMALASATGPGDAARAALLADDTWAAPEQLPLEVLRALGKAGRDGRLTDVNAVFQTFIGLQFEYVQLDTAMLQAIWDMRHNISSYDAAYLTVATIYDAPLVTFDIRLARAAEHVRPDVDVQLL